MGLFKLPAGVRTFSHRLEPEISGKMFLEYRNAWVLSGVAKVKNLGLSKVSIEQRGTAIIIDDLVLKTSQRKISKTLKPRKFATEFWRFSRLTVSRTPWRADSRNLFSLPCLFRVTG